MTRDEERLFAKRIQAEKKQLEAFVTDINEAIDAVAALDMEDDVDDSDYEQYDAVIFINDKQHTFKLCAAVTNNLMDMADELLADYAEVSIDEQESNETNI